MGIGDILVEVIGKDMGMGFEIIMGVDVVGFDSIGKFFFNGFSNYVEMVVFVGGFGESSYVGFGSDGFMVLDDGVGDDERDISVVFFEIF